MIESEISYLKNLLYSILAFILLLIFVSVSIFISKNADMEKANKKGLIAVTIKLLEHEKAIMLDEVITGNYKSSINRVEGVLNQMFPESHEIFLINSNNECLTNTKVCLKNSKYLQEPFTSTKYKAVNALDFIVIPFAAFNKSFGKIVIKLSNTELKNHFADIIEILLLPFSILLISWLTIFKYSENRIILPLLERLKKSLKDEQIAELGKKLAHDIRSPLAILQYSVDELGDEVESKELMLLGLERIDTIAENLLTKEKERNQIETQISTLLVRVEQIIREKEILHPRINFVFNTTEISNKTIKVSALNTICSSLENLINNSIQATANIKYPQISLNFKLDGENESVIVSDNGHGIPKDKVEDVMRGNYTSKSNGNGIGLSSSIKALAQLGYSLNLVKSSNNGTMFELSLG